MCENTFPWSSPKHFLCENVCDFETHFHRVARFYPLSHISQDSLEKKSVGSLECTLNYGTDDNPMQGIQCVDNCRYPGHGWCDMLFILIFFSRITSDWLQI